MAAQAPNLEQFEAYFQRADTDRDGRISGNEAVAFFQATNLAKQVLAQIWTYADQNRTGFLGRPEFYNALKLVTVALSNRDLTPEIVKAALYGPASAKIPAPQINIAATPGLQSNMKVGMSPARLNGTPTSADSNGVKVPHSFPPQHRPLTMPPQPQPSNSGFQSHLGGSRQELLGAGSLSVPQRPTSYDMLLGSTDGSLAKITSQVSSKSFSPASQEGIISTPSPITQPKTPEITGLFQNGSSMQNKTASSGSQVGKEESKSLSAIGNGFSLGSNFGDTFSVTLSQPKQNSTAVTYSAGSSTASSATTLTSSTDHSTLKPDAVPQPPVIQAQKFPSTEKKTNQHVLVQNSSSYRVAAGNLASAQSQPPWPRMTHSDVQKYSKVFMQVDTDRDGKITAEQARDLFFSWRLPREVLKRVWDLSDQDNDSMLTLREFCIALYLMERYREGHPLPTVLPNSVMFDGSLFPSPGQPATAYGFQHPQGTKSAQPLTSIGGRKLPRPVPVPQPDEPIQDKAKVPVLEKHHLDQLSTDEQDSLNKKFQEANAAEKKVADLEKDITEAKQKIQFYSAKMQELILYKSRCDNRLNEISARIVEEKREAESLAKKYEEKYNKVGGVASRLTIEESTFRDIQEKKVELYRAIVKLEHDNADGIQGRANQIQLDVEEIVKSLNERCKTYGLRGKPTSVLELPFGWQLGIEAAAADWDEVWDMFEDEGFTQVKELTLDVQNVIAPPRLKSSLIRDKVVSDNSDTFRSSSKADNNSELANSEDRLLEDERPKPNLDQTGRTPPDSPAGSNAVESPSMEFRDLRMRDINVNGSPRAFDTHSEYGGADSVLSWDKGFDEPGWGSFDAHYDADAASEFNSLKEAERQSENGSSSLFGDEDWGLNPIKTAFTNIDRTFPPQGPFFDSVPSTPLYNAAISPDADNTFMRKSPFAFADSVPSTPVPSTTSIRRSSEDAEEHYSSQSFSRFDSLNMYDTGPFVSREPMTRFDSFRSTKDSDYDQGYFAPHESLARFDSFRSTTDSNDNFGQFPPHDSLTGFDSMRSTRDSDHGYSMPSFDDGAGPFGSSDPFRTPREAQTPRKVSESWKAY